MNFARRAVSDAPTRDTVRFSSPPRGSRMSSSIEDAQRILRALFVQRRAIRDVVDDITGTLGVEPFAGVLTDLFVNVAGRKFTGRESLDELTAALRDLQRRYAYLRDVDVPAAARRLHAGLRGKPPPESSRFDTLLDAVLLLTRAIVDDTGLSGDDLEVYLLGSMGPFLSS